MNVEKLLGYGLPLFEGVHAADLDGIEILGQEQELGAWQTVFDQQDASFDLYFLLDGALLAVFWTSEGREIVFSRFPIGTYFGELAALDGTPRSLAVFAKTQARVLSLKRQTLLEIFDKVPLVRDRIVQHLVAQIRTLTLRSMEMTTMSVEQRVGSYLLRLAAEQGKLSNGAIIENSPTHSEIAGSIGANREMVSRSISKFVKRGAIKSSRQRIEILDPEMLSED